MLPTEGVARVGALEIIDLGGGYRLPMLDREGEKRVRTYGQTKDCAGCRFWSEMVAKCKGGGPVLAMCLSDGPLASKYTPRWQTCTAWKSGHYGAVDDPPNYGAETGPLYEAEERSA